jgi:hypothetical protein
MGTSMAAAQRLARSAMAHSGRFSERIAIRSPFSMPRLRRPIDSSSTAVRKASELMGAQAPSFLYERCSGFRKVSTE